MRLFDTHCHINDERFHEDRQDVIARMHEEGVCRAVVVADGTKPIDEVYALTQNHDFLFAASGVHPHDASAYSDECEQNIVKWMNLDKVVALGEIGIDYHYDLSPRDVQREVFIRQLDLAYTLKKPVILHIREAHGDATDILNSCVRSGRMPSGIMHCYTGSWESAKTYLDMGLYISFSGSLTFKNAPKLTEVCKNAPLDRLLVETDCPYMAPVPLRGRRNEPAYVKHVLLKLAEIKGIDPEYAAEQTYQNGHRAFKMEI